MTAKVVAMWEDSGAGGAAAASCQRAGGAV
jgi:hypothetical protein